MGDRVIQELLQIIDRLDKRITELETAEVNRFSILGVKDDVTAPGTITGLGQLYIDHSDGQLKIKYGDGSVETVENTGHTHSGLVTNGDSHDHYGGDGATILEESLESQVTNKLVTNGNSHDHSGGDGAAIPESGLASAVSAQLVTNGDSHNHIGGDGASIDTDAIASAAITASKIDTGAVVEAKIGNGAVTEDKIGSGAVTNGKIGTGAVTSAKIGTAQVANVNLGLNAVDDDNIGDRVPMFTRRQGGSSTSWRTQGTTSYTPTTVKMQGGSRTCAANSDTTITFPQSFSYAPIVLISFSNRSNWFAVWSISASSFTVNNELTSDAIQIDWLAIGQE